VTAEAGTQATIELIEEALEELGENAPKAVIQKFEQEGGNIAGGALEGAASAKSCALWGFLSSMKYRLLGGILGIIGGKMIGNIPDQIRDASREEYEKMPAFDDFAAECVGSTTWPTTASWDLESAEFRGPLVLSGSLKP